MTNVKEKKEEVSLDGFRDIEGYKGLYMVNNEGVIISLNFAGKKGRVKTIRSSLI